jgi:hypothetical protein
MKTHSVLTLLVAVSLAACGQSVAAAQLANTPPATLATPEQLRFFSISDARTIGLFIAFAQPDSAPGETCVTRTMEGSTTVLTGNGCTTGRTRYDGVLRFSGDPLTDPEARTEYLDWRQTSTSRCSGSMQTVTTESRTRGTVRVTARGNVRDYEVDLVIDRRVADIETCTETSSTLAVQYRGTLDFFGPSGVARDFSTAVRASGSGTVADSRYGRVDTTTTGLVFDPAICNGEPSSGTLMLRAGSHTGVVTYDGATRCGMGSMRTAPITVDGVAGGEVPVNACSVRGSAGSAKRGALGVIALGVALMGARARRRRVPCSRS